MNVDKAGDSDDQQNTVPSFVNVQLKYINDWFKAVYIISEKFFCHAGRSAGAEGSMKKNAKCTT
ncbi:hypothetical protein SD10_19520 [Spirosoma radiotolerans]|uniref:Uncharacterized protein n=1 Tax=Spirosoma radiotolerans TaxID=1379870 RepID=A0A0E3V8H7_9BACT|nr:hypothetical protein SD10_19520 [Spirosoma radiotolerans]